METPTTSIPFPIKSIWHFEYFEKEMFLLGICLLVAAVYLCYRLIKNVESQHESTPPPPAKPNWKAIYKALDTNSPDFAKRVEALLVEYAYEELRIPLRSSLTTEEKARLVASPDISLCLRLARDIRYSKSEEKGERLEELDRVAGRIFDTP